MRFNINTDLLHEAHAALNDRGNLYWIVGGSGSGKTTISQALAAKFDMYLYDMDAYIYGGYHGRFTPERHPVNTAWTSAENGLAWLLSMSWDEFNNFNQAALPEYVDLLTADLAPLDSRYATCLFGKTRAVEQGNLGRNARENCHEGIRLSTAQPRGSMAYFSGL
jgi:hypothetical protein